MASPINVADLPVQQLQEVAQQMDEEIQVLTQSFAKLRQATNKFNDSITIIKNMQDAEDDQSILVPMTSSLYVPGRIANKRRVTVDVGTGYFADMDTSSAIELYKRRVGFLKQNLEKLEATITSRQSQRSSVVQVLQAKINAIRAQSEATKASSSS